MNPGKSLQLKTKKWLSSVSVSLFNYFKSVVVPTQPEHILTNPHGDIVQTKPKQHQTVANLPSPMLCHAPTGAPGLCHLCHTVPFLCRSIPLPYPTYQPTLALPFKAFPLNSFRDFQYTTRTLRILHRFTLWQSVLCSVTPWTRIFATVSRPSQAPPSHQCTPQMARPQASTCTCKYACAVVQMSLHIYICLHIYKHMFVKTCFLCTCIE